MKYEPLQVADIHFGDYVSLAPNGAKEDFRFVTEKMITAVAGGFQVFGIAITKDRLYDAGFIAHHDGAYNKLMYIEGGIFTPVTEDGLKWGFYPAKLGSGVKVQGAKRIKYMHEIQGIYRSVTGIELGTLMLK